MASIVQVLFTDVGGLAYEVPEQGTDFSARRRTSGRKGTEAAAAAGAGAEPEPETENGTGTEVVDEDDGRVPAA